MKDEGWVKIHRKIWNNPWMKNPNYLVVWIWILTHAEYREDDDPEIGSYVLNGERINLKKGELTCGMKEIAEEIGTSRSTIIRTMTVFEKEGQIEQRANTKFTLIKVLNWTKYQDKRTTSGQRVEQPADTYKEDKNTRREEDKKEKGGSGHFVPPTLEELTAYCTERKSSVDPQRFSSFYQSKGWLVGKVKMKDWKAAIVTWETKDREEGKPNRLLEAAKKKEQEEQEQRQREEREKPRTPEEQAAIEAKIRAVREQLTQKLSMSK